MKIIINGTEKKNIAGFDYNENTVTLTFKTGKKKIFTSKKGWNIISEITDAGREIKFNRK